MSTTTWSAYRDRSRLRAAAAGAGRPPLPLTQQRALEHAVRLYRLGLSATAISVVMGHYHGHWASSATWYRRVRRAERGG